MPMELVEEIKPAVEYTKQKEYRKAEKIYLELLKEHPENPSLLSFLGILYYNLKKYKKAEKYLEKSYKLSPSKTIVSYIGFCKYELKKYRAAVFYLIKALEDKNNSYDVYVYILEALATLEQYSGAYVYAKAAINIYPMDEYMLNAVGLYALHTGKFQKCEQYANKLLFLNPKSYYGWELKGLLAEVLYCDDDMARECYKKVARYGDKIGGYHYLAISYSKDAKYRKKAYYYLRKAKDAIKSDNNPRILFSFSKYYLIQRKFKKGYKYYISMTDNDDVKKIKSPKSNSIWKGRTHKDETLFVYGDQGFGDQLQYIRYLPYLIKKFKYVKIMVLNSLLSLFKRSFKNYKSVRFYPMKRTYPHYDKFVLLTHTLYYLNKDFKHIPYKAGYLLADKKKVEKYKSVYFNNNKLKIGICWEAGSAAIHTQIHRTVNIECFEDIINLENAEVYSFQVNPSLENYKKYPNLIDLGSTFNDFDDTAAALKNLDVFIVVDTSAAHLAGALGVKTFLLLPYCADWRWFDNTETTEWYESVKIFKQTCKNSWENEFKRMQQELTLMIKK